MKGKVNKEAAKIEKQISQFEETKQAIANEGAPLKLDELPMPAIEEGEDKNAKDEESSDEEPAVID